MTNIDEQIRTVAEQTHNKEDDPAECIQDATELFMQVAGQLEEIGFFDHHHHLRQARRRMMWGPKGEATEAFLADEDDDLVEYVDGLLDMIVVAWGSLFAAIGPAAAADCAYEVNRSNLSKVDGSLGPIKWDGEPGKSKVLKPEGWTPPDIRGILEKHGIRIPKPLSHRPPIAPRVLKDVPQG